MPQYLAEKEHGVNIVVTPTDTPAQQITPTLQNKCSMDDTSSNDFTLSSSSARLSNMGTNFSFTFNASENGDFIQRKGTNMKQESILTPQTPFQITKMLNKKTAAEAAALSKQGGKNSPVTVPSPTEACEVVEANENKPSASNLKTIGMLYDFYIPIY